LYFVLVSDDSSTDGVAELVRSYQKEMPNLIYSRNPENLGFSGNVSRLYELTTTRYAWFLCDDDTVYPGAIPKIIQSLERHEPVVAIFNCTWNDSYGRHLVTGDTEDRIYTDPNDAEIYNVLMRLTFLSIIVVEKKLSIDPIIQDPSYKDNVFVQLTLGLYLLSDRFKLCEFSPTIIHRNVGFKYGEFLKFSLLDPLKAVHMISHKFDNRKFTRCMIKLLPIKFQLFLSQKLGLFIFKGSPTRSSLNLLKQYYGPYYKAVILFFRAVCFLTPAPLVKFTYLLKLFWFHGLRNGISIYKQLVDRAKTDGRDTGFTTYR
jgi:glycosyltransferase involved in cell wall biosynthesis